MAQVRGLAEQLFRIARYVAVHDQEAAGGCGLKLVALPFEDQFPDQVQGFLGNFPGPGLRAVLDQQGESVSGQSCQGVTLMHPHAEIAGQLPQVAVTGTAAGQIVEAFKVIKIQIQQAVTGIPVGFLFQSPEHPGDEFLAVHQAGDRIVPDPVVAI